MDCTSQQYGDTLISLCSLSLGYGDRELLHEAAADLHGGELVALLGRNGSGKSTLLRAIAGLKRDYSGRILLGGRDMHKLSVAGQARLMAFVTTGRMRIEKFTCADLVALGRAPYTNWIGALGADDRRAVASALDAVGMSAYASRQLDSLSDGECQRVMIARALAQDTPVILLDEPTSFLDLPNRYELVGLLAALAHDHGKCVLYSTHELDIALRLSDRIFLIDPPRLISGSPAELRATGEIRRIFGIDL